jgi:hypothetical protein
MWWRRIVLWAERRRSTIALTVPLVALAVAAVALAVALGGTSRGSHARSASPSAVSRPSTTVPSLPISPDCRKDPQDVAAAAQVGRRVLGEFMAYSLGRLGPRPAFPDATPWFERAMWAMSHTPPPPQVGAQATVKVESARLAERGIVHVQVIVSIHRPGLVPFRMGAVVVLTGCRWLANGF